MPCRYAMQKHDGKRLPLPPLPDDVDASTSHAGPAAVGDRVRAHSLKGAPELNGALGTVTAVSDTQRVAVKFDRSSSDHNYVDHNYIRRP